MILALVSSGRSLFDSFGADEARLARRRAGVDRFDRPAAAVARGLLERGAAHGDDLLGVLRLDRGDGVAGVDRAGEGVLALDRQDVAKSASRRARRRRAGRCSCRWWWPARGRRRGRPSAAPRAARRSRPADARDARRRRHGPCRRRRSWPRPRRPPPTPDAGDQQMDFAELRRGGDRGQRRVLDRAAVMLDQNQRLHCDHSQRLQLGDQLVDRADLDRRPGAWAAR